MNRGMEQISDNPTTEVLQQITAELIELMSSDTDKKKVLNIGNTPGK